MLCMRDVVCDIVINVIYLSLNINGMCIMFKKY